MKKMIFSLICLFSGLLLVNAEVYDVAKITLAPHIAGINFKTGDAKLDKNIYEVYCDDELLFVSRNLVFYLPKHKDYVIKDISFDYGVQNASNLTIYNLNEDRNISFDKYALGKTYILDIKDDSNYKVYLKSDGVLYESFDKMYRQILLPYGTYEVKNEAGEVVKELVVDNTEEETLTLGEKIEPDIPEVEDTPKDKEEDEKKDEENSSSSSVPNVNTGNSDVDVDTEKEDTEVNDDKNQNLNDNKTDTIEDKEDTSNSNNEVENLTTTNNILNPQTGDDISLYENLLILSSGLIIPTLFFKNKLLNKSN